MRDLSREAILEEENALLRERIAHLEGLMGWRFVPPIEWSLTPSEGRVMGALVARELVTKEAIMAALYRDDGRDEAGIKIVDVFVCKIRKKVKPFGIEIKTVWAHGYALDQHTREMLAKPGRRAAA